MSSPGQEPRPAAFLDRDGVINYRIPGDTYVTCPEELRLLDHAAEVAKALQDRGYALVVVTNQRGVARGFMSEEELGRVHETMRAELSAAGVQLEAIYYCPHDRDEGCDCRKPRPGMLLRAKQELQLDLERSLLIGDSDHDLEAGRRAGVPLCILVPSNGDLREVLPKIPERA